MFGSPFGGAFFGEIWRILGVRRRLPDNIIVATVDVDQIDRTVSVADSLLTVTVFSLERSIHVTTAAHTVTAAGIQRTVRFDG
jgi:hypothetical protein